MITMKEDPVVFELTTTLREWHKIWLFLYLDNQINLFDRIGALLVALIDSRVELLTLLDKQKPTNNQEFNSASGNNNNNRYQQIKELKTDIVNKLDLGNRLLNLDLVPRDANFNLVDPVELSPVKLFQLHAEAAANSSSVPNQQASNGPYGYPESNASSYEGSKISSSSSSSSQASAETSSSLAAPAQNSCHLQMALKSYYLASLPLDELVEIYFSIVDATNNYSSTRPITDKFLIQIKNDELVCGTYNTIFTNLGQLHNRDVCLHVQVYRVGKMTLGDGYKTTFGRQQSNHNLQVSNQDGSTNSITSANKYTPNGLTRSRHSTLGYFASQSKYRRPFGTSMIPLKDYIRTANFKETSINLKVLASNESEFSTLHEPYAKRNQSLKTNQNLPNIQLDLTVKFIACSQELLPRLATISPYCITEKRGFPDIVMPGDFKNDLYIALESAEFEKGGKSISKNIEASISLIDKAGIVIDKCISPGSNCDNVSCYKSCVFYHSNSPKWNESIKINVPLTEFDSAHIRIEFRHCSTKERDKKFLGFAYLPLSDDDGTVIADKSHELYLYKCDTHLWEDESLNLCKYTSLPYGPNAKQQSNAKSLFQNNFSHSNRELINISTFLLSTKLTQNRNLLNLLKWRELIKRDKKEFGEALKKVLELTGEEIVKFLQDILDTLFETFTMYSTSEDDYSALIFKVLIHIFLLLDEPKYQHFRPVLDTYASAHFSATLVYKGLLACVKKCLESSSVVERHVPIQRCFKSIRYVFQFIVQSKLLLSKATGEQNDEAFLNDLRHLFKLFELMLGNSNPKIIPIQVTFLESFPGTLEHLIKVLSPQELAKVVTSLAGSAGTFQLPPDLSRAKLLFMKGTANSSLIKNQDIRLQIIEIFCRYLNCYIVDSEELDLCYEILEILIVKIHDYHWPSIYRLHQLTAKSKPQDSSLKNTPVMTVGEINNFTQLSQIHANQLDLAIMSVSKELEPFVNLMDPLLQLLDQLYFNIKQPVVQKYCTCLLTILKLMGKASFEQFMKRKKMDYTKLCNLFRSFRAVYNRDWSIMQLTSHAILEHPIDEISKDIRSKNDNNHHVNRQLSSYIKLIVDFITHPTLQLEAFSDRKKTYVLSVFGDLRVKFSAQLMRFWSELTKANIHELMPTSIQSILDAALLPSDELQQKLIPVFYDMINAEDHFKSNSRQLERCLMDNMDLFINLDRGNEKFVDNFCKILKRLIDERSPIWQQRGLKLIDLFVKLLQLLMNYRQALECCENRGKQMGCLVDLLNYYKDQDRMDLYLRYLFKLSEMHLEVGNHVEAAFTLKLYTDEIKWCNRNLSALDGYRPEEQEWRRKEVLYQRIIHYFDLGKCWEETIDLCKELASFYENFLVDYEKVSSTLKRLAQFLDNILAEHRPEREYFRVEFIGKDMPDYVRGKELIYRGGEYERLAAFMQRMNSEFPDALILNSKSKQSITKESLGQYLVISNVKPVPKLQEHFKSGQRNINDKVIQYYLNNRLDTFSYDIPIMKENSQATLSSSKEKSGELNVKNLWVGRYMLKTKKQLPDILLWSEVVSQEYIEISPINHAIETISSMNLELSKLILSYKNEPNKQISPLTMRLQGVIEAAVNGGPAVFVNAFLKRQPGEPENQNEPDLLIRLRDLIKQQFSILETGLALHSKLAPPEVRPLHDRLVERLQNTRKTLLEDANQIPENSYQELHQKDTAICVANRVAPAEPTSVASTIASGELDNSSKDEVDGGGHDLNGNIYGEIDDQTYSQPQEHQFILRPPLINGTKSEFSSPSRQHYASGASSSLSTLAVLSNLPVNRTRMSMTPSKDPPLQSTVLNLNNNDLCARAARRLTYDASKLAAEACKNNLDCSRTISELNGNKTNQEAPPLPPRSFLVEKQNTARAMSRSPFISSNRNPSPSDGMNGQRWPFKETHVASSDSMAAPRNLATLSSSEADRFMKCMDQMPSSQSIRISLPSNIPHLLKSSAIHYAQQVADSEDPPPLPQRVRATSSQRLMATQDTTTVTTAASDRETEKKQIAESRELDANLNSELKTTKEANANASS